MELPMLAEENLTDMSLADHLKISEPQKERSVGGPHEMIAEASGEISDTNNQDIAAAGRDAIFSEAVGILLKAAGLEPRELSARAAEDLLDQVGALVKEYTTGLTGMLTSRSDFIEHYELTARTSHENIRNPLRFVTGIKDSLQYLLGSDFGKTMPPEEAVCEIFRDLAYHQRAMLKAMSSAVDGYIEQFDPEAIEKAFNQDNTKTGNFLEQYAKAYEMLTKNGKAELPAPFNDEFVRAYAEELQQLKSSAAR